MDGTIKKSSKRNSISRRDFLKLSAAVGTVAALSDFAMGGPMRTLVEGARPQAATVQEDVWMPSVCFACDENCSLLVHRVNGVVVKIEGDPSSPYNFGRICARSNSGISMLYNPYR